MAGAIVSEGSANKTTLDTSERQVTTSAEMTSSTQPVLRNANSQMEESLLMFIAAISASVPPEELQEAAEKVHHREYGIALQVIGALILENGVWLASETKQRMIALMDEMGMNDPHDEDYWFWEKLRPTLQGGD